MPNFWPETLVLAGSAQEQRKALKAKIRRLIESGELDGREAGPALRQMASKAELRPRSLPPK
jgi:hypothetical protein